MHRFALAAAVLLVLGLTAAPAQAQRFRIPGTGGTLNPGNYYDPYGYNRRAAYNIRLYGRAMSQVPPYALGYNPYQPAINLYGSGYAPNYGYYVPQYGYPSMPLFGH